MDEIQSFMKKKYFVKLLNGMTENFLRKIVFAANPDAIYNMFYDNIQI